MKINATILDRQYKQYEQEYKHAAIHIRQPL